MRRSVISLAVGACLALGLFQGCGAPPPLRPNLVLITVDSLRPDRLSCYGGPDGAGEAICDIGRSGTRYSWAISPSPFTKVAITSMLTSRYPSDHDVTALVSSSLPSTSATLAEALREGGYSTGAFVGNPSLNRTSNLQQGFDIYDDRVPPSMVTARSLKRRAQGLPAAALTRAALDFAERATEPWFVWVHYGEPRGPYAPLEPNDSKAPPAYAAAPDVRSRSLLPLADHSGRGGIPAYQDLTPAESQPRAVASSELVRGYDAEIRRVDQQVRSLVEGLDSLGRPGVLITADHGEALGEDDYWFAHGHSVGLDQIWVPLLWRPPHELDSQAADSRGRIVRDPVSTLDVAATFLAAARLEIPLEFAGIPLSATPSIGGTARPIFSEHPLRAAVVVSGVYYARDRRPLPEPVRDPLRGGDLHSLPTRSTPLADDGRARPYRSAVTEGPGAGERKSSTAPAAVGSPEDPKLEAALAEFLATPETSAARQE